MLNRMESDFKVKLLKTSLLDKIKQNKEKHSELVKESKAGYLVEAEKHLKDRLKRIKDGECVSLNTNLAVPKDYTSEYDSCIQMFEMHQEEMVELSIQDFNKLVNDRWDWANDFFNTNARYSSSVAAMSNSR